MKSLIHTNPFLKDASIRDRVLKHSVLESSYFEGARGVTLPPARKMPRRKPSAKKRANGS